MEKIRKKISIYIYIYIYIYIKIAKLGFVTLRRHRHALVLHLSLYSLNCIKYALNLFVALKYHI